MRIISGLRRALICRSSYLTEQGATLRMGGQIMRGVPAIKVEQLVVFGNINLTARCATFFCGGARDFSHGPGRQRV